MNRNLTIFALLILSVLCSVGAADGLSDKTRKCIEADWARQERVSRNLKPTDPAALTRALDRAAKMVADMRSMGNKTAAAKA